MNGVRRSSWFLVGCLAVGALALWQLLPPRTPPDAGAARTVSMEGDVAPLMPGIRPSDAVRGPPDAEFTIIEYGDFTCPACVAAHATLEAIRQERGPRIRFVWRDFPALDRITGSRRAHVAARCAQRQRKFWEFHDAVLDRQLRDDAQLRALAGELGLDTAAFVACVSSETTGALVDLGLRDAALLGLRTAPTFFVNGMKLEHPTDAELRAALQK